MQAIFNKINMHVDDYFYHSLSGISNNIKTGLNINNIYSQINSPTGNLIDYNVRVLIYNCTTLGVIVELALLTLGINLIANAVFAGTLLFVRYKVKKDLNDFWYQRAARVAVETSVDFVNKAAELFNWVTNHQDQSSKEVLLIAGKDFGPFRLFKTVSSIDELCSRIKSEAKLNSDSDEKFNSLMKNLPASTGLFLTLLKINAYFQSQL